METKSRINDTDTSDGGIGEKVEHAKETARTLGTHFKELAEYISHYWTAKADAMKLSVRNAILYAALGIIGLFAVIAFAATTIVLLCVGLAHGLGVLIGERYWLGDIVLAVAFLGAMAIGIRIAVDKVTKTSKSATVGKYEQRERAQRKAVRPRRPRTREIRQRQHRRPQPAATKPTAAHASSTES